VSWAAWPGVSTGNVGWVTWVGTGNVGQVTWVCTGELGCMTWDRTGWFVLFVQKFWKSVKI